MRENERRATVNQLRYAAQRLSRSIRSLNAGATDDAIELAEQAQASIAAALSALRQDRETRPPAPTP